jgi:hypothetical protein
VIFPENYRVEEFQGIGCKLENIIIVNGGAMIRLRFSFFRRFTAAVVVITISLGLLRDSFNVSAENSPQQIASYKIEVQLKLDERSHPTNLEGREQLTCLPQRFQK